MFKHHTIRNLCFSGGSIAFFSAMLVIPSLFASCEGEDQNAERREKIEVYQSLEEDPINVLKQHVVVGAQGGDITLYVKTNIDFTPAWQDAESSPWATVKSCEKTSDDCYELVLNVNKRYSSAYYTLRSGTLTLSSPENYYGTYITVDQGMTARLSNNFSWLKYGSSDPRKMDGTLISQWSSTLQAYGYKSTVIDGEENAYCYGKNGYIMLGDGDGHGADFITPYVESFRSDSLLVLSFRAVAYTSLYGIRDADKLSLQVQGGGVICGKGSSRTTEISFDVPYYDLEDETFPDSMWQGTSYLVFIQSTDASPLTSDTQMRFLAGSLSKGATNNRLFIDNIYIYAPSGDEEFQLYFDENSGSGPDVILGLTPSESDKE